MTSENNEKALKVLSQHFFSDIPVPISQQPFIKT